MDRQAQFRAREALIFEVAEQLLLDNGEAGMTLDALAAELDLAKGTLYKHFQSKDELYMLLIVRNERMLLEMVQDKEKPFQSIWHSLCCIIYIIPNVQCYFIKSKNAYRPLVRNLSSVSRVVSGAQTALKNHHQHD